MSGVSPDISTQLLGETPDSTLVTLNMYMLQLYIPCNISNPLQNRYTILITGGTGLIGTHLTQQLLQFGYTIYHLSRKKSNSVPVKCFHWDPQKGIIDDEAVLSADCIIHLAGENIGGKRWTAEQKEKIIQSRVQSARLLFDTCSRTGHFPSVFISASGTGYYGMVTTEKIFTEENTPYNDFLGNTCELWEKAAGLFDSKGVRTVILRTGVVLSMSGGALPQMVLPVKYCAGAVMGTGKQWMPWIHIDDICNMYLYAIENINVAGVYNAVAPENINFKALTEKIAQILHRPLILPKVPEFALKLMLGEMAGLVLYGSRVACGKILSEGFQFRYCEIGRALASLMVNPNPPHSFPLSLFPPV